MKRRAFFSLSAKDLSIYLYIYLSPSVRIRICALFCFILIAKE